jgi:MraZ protein
MFRGSSFHTIDEKGRFAIPARFRDILRASEVDGVTITTLDGCLKVYTREEWRKIEERILDLAEKSDTMRRFRRWFIGRACECVCDKQGRVLIPQVLRQYAGMDRDIVLVGVLDHFEIWDRSRWDEENTALEEDMKMEDLKNQIAKLGL